MKNMNNFPMQTSVGVMPETIFIIGGQVAKDFSTEESVAKDTYDAMIFLKSNFMMLTQELSEIFTQCQNHLDLETAHELTYTFLCEKLSKVIPNRNKRTTWNDLKDAAKTETEVFIMNAIETASNEELSRLSMAYPDLVDMYEEFIEN